MEPNTILTDDLHIRVTAKQKSALEAVAKLRRQSVSEVARWAIQQEIEYALYYESDNAQSNGHHEADR